MKEWKLDGEIREKVTSLLHENQKKQLNMQSGDGRTFWLVNEDDCYFVECKNPALETIFSISTPELQGIEKELE